MKNFLKQWNIWKFNFDFISDTHININKIDFLMKKIIKNKRSDILFILWDIIQNKQWEDITNKINKLLNSLSKNYEKILYLPWNHDLRWKKEIFNNFDLEKNIFMPKNSAIKLNINWKNILLVNIFYSLNFFNKKIKNILEITDKEIINFYNKLPDWTTLFIDFEEMKNFSKNLDLKNIDIIASHCMTHPVWIKIKTITKKNQSIENLKNLLKEKNIIILHNKLDEIYYKEEKIRENLKDFKIEQFNNFNVLETKKLNLDFEKYIKWIFIKNSILGTDIFQKSDFKDWIISIHWHYHKKENPNITKIINWKKVHFLSNTKFIN